MKNVTYGLIIITMILFLGLGFFQSPLLANTENEIEAGEEVLLNITTVSKNQYSMVKSIVLNKHNVEYLSENESEIYKFKYNEDIINNISGRDLFMYSGINNEPWVNDFIAELKKGDLGIINMSRGIKTLTYENGNENPYYWLGINEYKIALYNVKSAIQEKDPKNKSYYEDNYTTIINKIEESAKEVKLELEKYKDYTILTNTNTFDYLLRDLGLQVVNVKKEVTRKILDEKKLDENKIIFVKEKDPIEIVNIIETKKEDEKVEETKKTNEEKLEVPDIEAKKPLDIKSVELIRWDGEKTLVELALSNIKLVTDTLKKLPIVTK